MNKASTAVSQTPETIKNPIKPEVKALTPEQIRDLFHNASTEELVKMGGDLALKVHGNKVLLRGLMEYTNICESNCLYCGIRRDNSKAHRYRVNESLLLEAVDAGFKKGLKTFVIQGGEDPEYDVKRICDLVKAIKLQTNGEAAITLSCGMRSLNQYKEMRAAGADRYLLRFETSDPELHKYIRDGKTLETRLRCHENIRKAGFQTGSGFMLGLPGETEETRLNNILLCQSLQPDMAGIGPFIPHPDTPLGDAPQQSLEHSIRATALLRLALPYCHIPATTAAGTLEPDGREQMIAAGANVLMPNITQVEFKKDYLLYPGKICLDESGIQCIGCLGGRVMSVGRELSFDRGDALRLTREPASGDK